MKNIFIAGPLLIIGFNKTLLVNVFWKILMRKNCWKYIKSDIKVCSQVLIIKR